MRQFDLSRSQDLYASVNQISIVIKNQSPTICWELWGSVQRHG